MKTLILLTLVVSSPIFASIKTVQIAAGKEVQCSEIPEMKYFLLKMTDLRVLDREITHGQAIEEKSAIHHEFQEYEERCKDL